MQKVHFQLTSVDQKRCSLSSLLANFVPGICEPRGHSQAFDTHAVCYQNITTQRILLGKKADWLICQGQEKIEEGWKGMFLILCTHFFIAYQARITERNRELST